MEVDVSTKIVIERPVEHVASFSGDPDHAPLWYSNIKSVQWQTARPLQIGSRIEFIAHFLGKRLAYTYEIVELVPGKRLIMRTAEGPFPMETIYTWEAAGENATRMTLRNRGTPTGFSKWFAPFMAMAIRRANQRIWRSSRSASNRPAPNNRREPIRQAREQKRLLPRVGGQAQHPSQFHTKSTPVARRRHIREYTIRISQLDYSFRNRPSMLNSLRK
jgi:hypothetical protein